MAVSGRVDFASSPNRTNGLLFFGHGTTLRRGRFQTHPDAAGNCRCVSVSVLRCTRRMDAIPPMGLDRTLLYRVFIGPLVVLPPYRRLHPCQVLPDQMVIRCRRVKMPSLRSTRRSAPEKGFTLNSRCGRWLGSRGFLCAWYVAWGYMVRSDRRSKSSRRNRPYPTTNPEVRGIAYIREPRIK